MKFYLRSINKALAKGPTKNYLTQLTLMENKNGLDADLKELRSELFLRKTCLINKKRLFYIQDNNIKFEVDDYIARGLDYARGAGALIDTNQEVQNKLRKLVNAYLQKMNISTNLKDAKNEFITFTSTLNSLLVKEGIYTNVADVAKKVASARDVLWKTSFGGEEFITVSNHTKGLALRTYKPLEDCTTPMSRNTPQLANAYDINTEMYDKKYNLFLSLNETIVAITEPYQLKDESKQEATFENHAILMSEERVKAIIGEQFKRWGADNNSAEITIPVFHQTLIVDSLFYTPDYKKSQTALDNKNIANAQMQQYYDDRQIYRDNATGDITISDLNSSKPANCTKIKIKVLSVNNCINMHEKASFVRNTDVEHTQELLNLAATKLESLRSLFKNDDKNLQTVINFINSAEQNYLVPDISVSHEVKQAVEVLSQNIDKKSVLLLQAAVELKCITHESHFDAMARKLNNAVPNIPVIGLMLRALIFCLTLTPRIALAFYTLYTWVVCNQNGRKSVYKSVYEGIVAQLLGGLTFGCMSACDRANEISGFRRAMLQNFHDNNRLISFYDSVEVKDSFFKTYANTQDKHNAVTMMTGIPSTNDSETRSLFGKSELMSDHETDEEKKISREHIVGRYPVKAITPYEKYLTFSSSEIKGSDQLLSSQFNSSYR